MFHRQALNVYRMKLLGAKVNAVRSGSKTLKDAMNEALRDWVTNVDNTFYIIGTVAGPHPYPKLVRDFQAVIGREARAQCLQQTGNLPDVLVACVGGGSNAIGLFYPFLTDAGVRMFGVEAGGHGIETGEHAAPLNDGVAGVLHGNRTYLMADQNGADHADTFRVGGSRLSRCRPRARLAERYCSGRLCGRKRRRGAGGLFGS